MSVVLSSITGQTKESTVKVGEAEVTFTYKPYAVTLGLSMTLSEGGTELTEVLAGVMDAWDVVEVEGEPFPPTEENLKKIPTELASRIASKIVSAGSDEVGEAGSS